MSNNGVPLLPCRGSDTVISAELIVIPVLRHFLYCVQCTLSPSHARLSVWHVDVVLLYNYMIINNSNNNNNEFV